MTTDVSSKPDVISPRLIEHGVEVGAELISIDTDVCCGQGRNLRSGDERAPAGAQGAQLGDGLTIPGDDERFTGGHRLHDLRDVVAQLPLRNRFRHIGQCSEQRYALLLVPGGRSVISERLAAAERPQPRTSVQSADR